MKNIKKEREIKKEHTYSYYLKDYNESGSLKQYVIVKDGKEIFHSNGFSSDKAIEEAKAFILEEESREW